VQGPAISLSRAQVPLLQKFPGAQLFPAPQPIWQWLPSQGAPLHDMLILLATGQAPLPSQKTGGEYMPVPAEQLSCRQVVSLPYFLQVPVISSQVPDRPQDSGRSFSQVLAQQMFITQWPEPQSMSVSQRPPFLVAGGPAMASGCEAAGSTPPPPPPSGVAPPGVEPAAPAAGASADEPLLAAAPLIRPPSPPPFFTPLIEGSSYGWVHAGAPASARRNR
jgi:hypothetical protein